MMDAIFIFLHYASDLIGFVEKNVFNRKVLVNCRLLRQKSHPHALPRAHFPVVWLDFTGQNPQKGRFANSVVPHESKFLTLGYSE
jgi:hypothetical protein